MKTLSPVGATLVDEAKAVAIINFCLFGAEATRPALPPRPKTIKQPRKAAPQKTPALPVKCPLDDVVLRKYTAPKAITQVTPTPARKVRALWQPRDGLSFPRGLCYLMAVQEHNWPSATVELGYYPTVTDLLCSPLVEKFSTFLVEQAPGLYHMKGRFV